MVLCVVVLWASAPVLAAPERSPRPVLRPVLTPEFIPAARWDHRGESEIWTLAVLRALSTHGNALTQMVPKDVADWCPAYPSATPPARRAFWVGFLSALAKHESTWRPRAVGGGGKWYGLLQILPATARGYGCKARTGTALQTGTANLACAIRIMAVPVPRDGVIHARRPKWGGVSADWGPMRSPAKRQDMANWLRGQEYCQMASSPRPMPRPVLPVVRQLASDE